MSTPRQEVAAQLAADNATFDVRDYPFTPKNVNVGKPVLSVWRDDVAPGDTAANLGHGLTVHAYGSKTAGAAAEDELDDLLDAVWLSIERLRVLGHGYRITSATRALFANDTVAGWVIKIACTSPNVYRETIKKERAE